MSDPFKIDGPTCISLSGGRTSAYLLWRLLRANDGLPSEAIVCFANTGKEEEATLRFVSAVAQAWDVTVVWLEYRHGAGFAVVDFATASRNGEPFEAVIAQRAQFTGPLPNPRSRYCSSELKTRTMKRYLRSIGWAEWDSFVGIRADEQRRVARFRANQSPDGGHETVRIPLADAGVTAAEVGTFWARQPFDLELPNNNGKTMHGNCDLCFLKPAAQIQALIAEKPSRAIWWAAREEEAASRLPPLVEAVWELDDLSGDEWTEAVDDIEVRRAAGEFEGMDEDEIPWPQRRIRRQKIGLDGKPMVRQRPNTGAVFRTDRPSYVEMARFAAEQRDMFDPDEEAIACFCGD